jgi:hypothetical protein
MVAGAGFVRYLQGFHGGRCGSGGRVHEYPQEEGAAASGLKVVAGHATATI